jgi:hypothetical protein
MYRVVLVLGLLVTPANANKLYTKEECGRIVRLLDHCKEPSPGGKSCSWSGHGSGADYWLMEDDYKEWGWEWNCHDYQAPRGPYCEKGPELNKLNALCQQVCNHEITHPEAVHQFCPEWKAAISSGAAPAEEGGEGPAAPATVLVGDVVFPAAVNPIYAREDPNRARFHTCVDQYNSNKSANANGDLKWSQRGGGYWSACSKRLGGL